MLTYLAMISDYILAVRRIYLADTYLPGLRESTGRFTFYKWLWLLQNSIGAVSLLGSYLSSGRFCCPPQRLCR